MANNFMNTTPLALSELQLADTVMDSECFTLGLMTVKSIKNGELTFFRPYASTADFSYTGGVICYTGIEETTINTDDTRATYHLISRRTLK